MSDSLHPHGLYSLWSSSDQDTRVGSISLLQGIFPTQGWNPDILRCKPILYQLSHKGSPRILEWVAYPFSSRFSWPKNQTEVYCIASGFFISWAIREAQTPQNKIQNSGNKDFLCEYGYLCFKIHNLVLSDQNEIRFYINNKRKIYWTTWKCHFIAYKKDEC